MPREKSVLGMMDALFKEPPDGFLFAARVWYLLQNDCLQAPGGPQWEEVYDRGETFVLGLGFWTCVGQITKPPPTPAAGPVSQASDNGRGQGVGKQSLSC